MSIVCHVGNNCQRRAKINIQYVQLVCNIGIHYSLFLFDNHIEGTLSITCFTLDFVRFSSPDFPEHYCRDVNSTEAVNFTTNIEAGWARNDRNPDL